MFSNKTNTQLCKLTSVRNCSIFCLKNVANQREIWQIEKLINCDLKKAGTGVGGGPYYGSRLKKNYCVYSRLGLFSYYPMN